MLKGLVMHGVPGFDANRERKSLFGYLSKSFDRIYTGHLPGGR